MTVYFPKSHYDKDYRGQTFPLLKPFLKGKYFTDKERVDMYGISEEDVELVNVLETSDVAILTMSWNYYMNTKQQAKAIKFLKKTQCLHKPTWVVLLDDVGLDFPDYSHVKLFRQSGYRSKAPNWHVGLPVFISDPLKVHFNRDVIFERLYAEKPTVGFCGFANSNTLLALKTKLKIGVKNLGYHLKLHTQEPEKLYAPAEWRYNILKRLEAHKDILTNFIYRAQYRAGASSEVERKASALEFFNNIKNSDYVLCVRGAGNFSKRLYETLAMGRIPVFVNTDCILPLADGIDWKNHVVWVEADEIDQIGHSVNEFHKALNEISFVELQRSNRWLWENKLQLKGLL